MGCIYGKIRLMCILEFSLTTPLPPPPLHPHSPPLSFLAPSRSLSSPMIAILEMRFQPVRIEILKIQHFLTLGSRGGNPYPHWDPQASLISCAKSLYSNIQLMSSLLPITTQTLAISCVKPHSHSAMKQCDVLRHEQLGPLHDITTCLLYDENQESDAVSNIFNKSNFGLSLSFSLSLKWRLHYTRSSLHLDHIGN